MFNKSTIRARVFSSRGRRIIIFVFVRPIVVVVVANDGTGPTRVLYTYVYIYIYRKRSRNPWDEERGPVENILKKICFPSSIQPKTKNDATGRHDRRIWGATQPNGHSQTVYAVVRRIPVIILHLKCARIVTAEHASS